MQTEPGAHRAAYERARTRAARTFHAEKMYKLLVAHQNGCHTCTTNALDPDGMCTPGRIIFYDWMKAEREAGFLG